jgi:hypothetical protein
MTRKLNEFLLVFLCSLTKIEVEIFIELLFPFRSVIELVIYITFVNRYGRISFHLSYRLSLSFITKKINVNPSEKKQFQKVKKKVIKISMINAKQIPYCLLKYEVR